MIDMASTLGPANRETIAAVPGARQALEAMGAQPFLDRLDAVLAAPAAGSDSTIPSGDTVARQA